jgi:type I restriction enzyme, S subunit
VPGILERFRQSVLAAATSGELTREWREARGMAPPSAWVATTLQALCSHARVISYSVIQLAEETTNGAPCLRTSNVRWLRLELEGMKGIARSLSDGYSRTILRGGEILVKVPGTLGGVAVVSAEMAGWNVSREVAAVPADVDKVDPYQLNFGSQQNEVSGGSRASKRVSLVRE